MTVKFNVTARKDLQDGSAPPKYYPIARSVGRADSVEIAKTIADISTVSVVDTEAVISAFLKVVPEKLADGKIVELGDFGTFRISLSGEASETAEEVNATNIVDVKVIFTPGKRFKKVLATLDFQKEKQLEPQPAPPAEA